MINPALVSASWGNYCAQNALLLADFSPVYYVCDDYAQSVGGKRCGFIRRISLGSELYVLEGKWFASPTVYMLISRLTYLIAQAGCSSGTNGFNYGRTSCRPLFRTRCRLSSAREDWTWTERFKHSQASGFLHDYIRCIQTVACLHDPKSPD